MPSCTVLHGDCRDVIKTLPDCSVDAIVTDPPYGLEFMGKEWDRPWAVSASNSVGYEGRDKLTLPSHRDNRNANCRACGGRQRGAKRCACTEPKWDRHPAQDMVDFQHWFHEIAIECLRVLKPGGHLLAFGGTRTYHRMTVAIEDAGFEIRDSIHWLYGSGFPKSLDVSKAIDKAAGAEREVTRKVTAGIAPGSGNCVGGPKPIVNVCDNPATDAARQWEGWGTALKPAHEPIVVARKPLSGTVAATVLEHGTGALNIDGCRVGSGADKGVWPVTDRSADRTAMAGPMGPVGTDASVGRWPANLVLTHAAECVQIGTAADSFSVVDGLRDYSQNSNFGARAQVTQRQQSVTVPVYQCAPSCPVAALDAQSGVSKSQGGRIGKKEHGAVAVGGTGTYKAGDPGFGDTGGASRFFTTTEWDPIADTVPFRYVAKPSKRERNAGLSELPSVTPSQRTGRKPGSPGLEGNKSLRGQTANPYSNGGGSSVANTHPTVKPLALMRWLVRLVTPHGGTVLEPFAGSGTTLMAATLEGFDSIGIELTEDYLPIIEGRVAWAQAERERQAEQSDPSLFDETD